MRPHFSPSRERGERRDKLEVRDERRDKLEVRDERRDKLEVRDERRDMRDFFSSLTIALFDWSGWIRAF